MGKNKLKYYIENDYMVCICNNGQRFIFDIEDYNKIKNYTWYIHRNMVTCSDRKTKKNLSFCRFILGITDSCYKVLHKNKNSLDCRKENLFYKNTYEFKDDYCIGYCYDGKSYKIDVQDYDLVSKYVWHIDKNGYVITKFKNKVYKLHRLILNITDPLVEIDHIYHDKTDNRRSQLRIVNHSQNMMNTSIRKNNKTGIKGVYKIKGYNKWLAQISYNGKKKYLGCFDTIEQATSKRLEAEQLYHKEYKYSS